MAASAPVAVAYGRMNHGLLTTTAVRGYDLEVACVWRVKGREINLKFLSIIMFGSELD